MKQTLSVFLILAVLIVKGQLGTDPNQNICSTKLPKNYAKWRNSIIQNNVNTLKHDLCVNKQFSIVFYVVADSTGGWGTLTPANLTNCINLLNSVFKRICVSFANCSTVVIPHHPFNRWTKDTIEPAARAGWWTQNTINLYLPDSIVGPVAGYASLPGGPGAEIIVIEKGAIAGGTTIHEMGHFFGLPHTWDEIGLPATPPPPGGGGSNEFVRRTNCYINGDGFCDTEADCFPRNYVRDEPCSQVPGAKDGYQDYYTPPVDNYMTYFTCKCKFTQEQYNFMANMALTQLLYLH